MSNTSTAYIPGTLYENYFLGVCMKEFQVMDMDKIGITAKEFEVLEDVLSEIRESREYEGEDNDALNNLQHYFSYKNYKIFSCDKK